ncbi:MAG: hypothetical protein A2921_04550 [Candidatus Magasanikbacteria bacterium RIFCSPLOWO2_01_FULL_43_20b]|uniref:SHS2 domain-containing protein n=1 Tax=Candidatus Magasanikbacteria bacterium RIFCSPLOWO2_12_FULL_43_12 TaxID=1798692 RepID=A0A1F6MRK1_9BACT|nr:MAG: hypothetical protein A3C74_02605 [Candidatus Magasanikbacteria bacterium RIFCSPHIGHO2_02_FULL_44_13]OGH72599.1 MAG: hypothetical protein A3I93_01560 [Candidatus Magasanikbacteria bacterium RIFCSPLOWO2_02_FULL_43_22]OGH73337.1 MAG: hypothetical protein A2921_04550 [Candidatus Magasanikbacteria bacterium RIFCSPLOWO2_01_FULL_43_20b]OGH74150.1 MAG: hypothetical protein A3G00_02895 [Candidatus Magasanikbacteria bacterium RIFCSPLOWO2_12_FULL_43_12]
MGILVWLWNFALEMFFRSKLIVGLDIGSHTIKLAKLRRYRSGRVELVAFETDKLPPETIVDGRIFNFDAVVKCIRGLARKVGVEGADCAISISDHSVIIKKINIPKMTMEELEGCIEWEAEQYIPFDIKDINVDVQILNPDAGQDTMDVLLVAGKKDIVRDYKSVAEEAGLRPVVVDADTFACQNAFWLNYGFPLNEVVALVNVGDSEINISVVSNSITVFTRNISMGGSFLTEEIMKGLNVSWEDAEKHKTEGDDTLSSSAVFREVQKISGCVSETLVTEIRHSLDFFAATTINADISRIYLSGGAAQMSAFIRAMERRLIVPVELINPWRNIVIDLCRFDMCQLERMSPLATVAVGLAMRFNGDRKAKESGVRINLAHQERNARRSRRPWRFHRLPWSVSLWRYRLTLAKD